MIRTAFRRAARFAAGTATLIQIYAAGTTGTESVQLLVGDTVIAQWDNVAGDPWNRQFEELQATVNGPVAIQDCRIAFVNDDGPRDLRVDRIVINGTPYETEAPGVWSTGTWVSGSITPGFWQSEWLHGNGWFEFGGSHVGAINGRLGTVQFTDEWTVVADPVSFDDGIAILGPATHNESDPGAISCRLVDSQGFDLRFQEWPGEDGPHGQESADWMLLPRGRFETSDGSVWETGSIRLAGDGIWTNVNFSATFSTAPHVFLTIQTNDGNRPLVARVREVTPGGFEAALFRARAEQDPAAPDEVVGYVAVRPAAQSGVVAIGSTAVPYRFESLLVDTALTPIGNGLSIQLEEERIPGDPGHPPEQVSVLQLGRLVFAQVQSFADPDPVSLRVVKLPDDVTLPPGFRLRPLISGADLDDAVALDVAADGRIFIAEESGRILVTGPDGGTPELWMDISRDVFRAFADEGAMSGFRLDPDFLRNGYCYALYPTGTPGSTFGRLARFRRSPEPVAGPGQWERTVLVGHSRADGLIHDRFHNVGDIEFGFDGSLLFSWGDAAGNDETDPGQLRSQDLAAPAGKLFRVDPATGQGYRGNPFYRRSPSTWQSRVWAMGLRNGFRFAVHPWGWSGASAARSRKARPGTIYIGEVGRYRFDELNIARGGENFGWPRMEGPLPYRPDTSKKGKKARFVLPAVALAHPDTSAVIVGDFCASETWPAAWQGTLFAADFVQGWIRAWRPGPGHSSVSEARFGTGLRGITDMRFDPASGALLILGRGEDIIFSNNTGLDGLFRIEFDPNE